MATKWGVAGAGKITNDFVASLKISPEKHNVVAVAARHKERANEFAQRFDIPRAYGSYQELAEDGDIDIVYVGVINTEHLAVAELMMKHGKNVLCEKPLGLNYDQTCHIIETARTNKVFLMEAVWSRFNPIYVKLREVLAAGTIGKIRQVMVFFGAGIDADRVRLRSAGGGGLLDIGIYGLQFVTMVYGNREPTSVQSVGALTEDGVDEYAHINMKFGDSQIATVCYSISNRFENSALIFGSKGHIKICDQFFTPTKMLINDVPFEIQLPKPVYPKNYPNSEGMLYEGDYVKKCVDEGLLECPIVPHSETLLWAKIMTEIRQELGVKYKEDDD